MRAATDSLGLRGLALVCAALPFFVSPAAAQEDETTLVIVRGGEPGPASDLIAFEALVEGDETAQASDFGLIQQVDDGYAIAAIRVRISEGRVSAQECEGGLAPSGTGGLFEGAYRCGEEVPVPLSYFSTADKLLPNMIDPNGTWAEDGFFVSTILSIKIDRATAIALPPGGIVPVGGSDPAALTGQIGRVAPPHIQKSGACGEGVAVFFPLASTGGCATAAPFAE